MLAVLRSKARTGVEAAQAGAMTDTPAGEPTKCTCDLMDPSPLTDPALCPVHRRRTTPAGEGRVDYREWLPFGSRLICSQGGIPYNEEALYTLAAHLSDSQARLRAVEAERDRLKEQSERPKCMYCTFGEDADFSIEDLKQHIENECDFHPLRKLKADAQRLREALDDVQILLAEPGTPPKSVWYAWQDRHRAAFTPPHAGPKEKA